MEYNKDTLAYLHSLSIRGRYACGYLCLTEVINKKDLPNIPGELDRLICEFTTSNQLDEWLAKVEVILPNPLIKGDDKDEGFHNAMVNVKKQVTNYYNTAPDCLLEILEDLLWLGTCNLFGAFDTDISIVYIDKILKKLQELNIALPNIKVFSFSNVDQDGGWGEHFDIKQYIGG